MQYQQDKSVVDSKLQHYLAQERDLLHKIAAAEKVAAHGGQWPAEGMPRSHPAPKRVFVQGMAGTAVDVMTASKKSQTEQLQQISDAKAKARGGVENTVIDSIVRTMKSNKLRLAHDNVEAQDLGKEQQSLIRQMSELRAADRRLTKELVHAELQRSQA